MGRGEREGEPVTRTEGNREDQAERCSGSSYRESGGQPFSASLRLHFLSLRPSLFCLSVFSLSQKGHKDKFPNAPRVPPPVCGPISRFLDQNGKQRARLTSGSGAPPTGSCALSILCPSQGPLPAHTSCFLESSGGIHLIPLMC